VYLMKNELETCELVAVCYCDASVSWRACKLIHVSQKIFSQSIIIFYLELELKI
jgi:hypothetical protein